MKFSKLLGTRGHAIFNLIMIFFQNLDNSMNGSVDTLPIYLNFVANM